MLNSKKWVIATMLTIIACLAAFALPTLVFDPLLHYHKPLDGWEYKFDNERYSNDGITRQFEYTAMITGASMTSNFKSSEFDELFDARSIKVPFSGGGLGEVCAAIGRAAERNPNLQYVLCSLDQWAIALEKEYARNNYMPEFLYDNNLFNDTEYIFNKEVLIDHTLKNVIMYTLSGGETTNFDDYQNWMGDGAPFGRNAVLSSYTHQARKEFQETFDEQAENLVYENLAHTLIPLISENPDITFYLFYPPISIAHWDVYAGEGRLEYNLGLIEYTAKLLLPYENVRVFSFFDEYDMICNLDNYMDKGHFHEDINSKILKWIKSDEKRVTEENFDRHFKEIYEFYNNYDYESLIS